MSSSTPTAVAHPVPSSTPPSPNSALEMALALGAGLMVLIMVVALVGIESDKKWDEARRVMQRAFDRLKQFEAENNGELPFRFKNNASILVELNIEPEGLNYFLRDEFKLHRTDSALPAGLTMPDGTPMDARSSDDDAKRRRWYIEVHAGSREFDDFRTDANGRRVYHPPMGTARLYSTGEWEGPLPLPAHLMPDPSHMPSR